MSGKRSNERDERVKLPLDPETALRALLGVDPDAEPAGEGQDAGHGQKRSQGARKAGKSAD